MSLSWTVRENRIDCGASFVRLRYASTATATPQSRQTANCHRARMTERWFRARNAVPRSSGSATSGGTSANNIWETWLRLAAGAGVPMKGTCSVTGVDAGLPASPTCGYTCEPTRMPRVVVAAVVCVQSRCCAASAASGSTAAGSCACTCCATTAFDLIGASSATSPSSWPPS